MMLKFVFQMMDFVGEIDLFQLYQDLDNVYKILLLSLENIFRDRNNLVVEVFEIVFYIFLVDYYLYDLNVNI